MHEEHRANRENTRKGKQRETKKKTKQKENYKKIKGTKKRRKGITRHESPRLRPIKKSSTKRSKHLITGTIQILKSPSISFLPNTP